MRIETAETKLKRANPQGVVMFRYSGSSGVTKDIPFSVKSSGSAARTFASKAPPTTNIPIKCMRTRPSKQKVDW